MNTMVTGRNILLSLVVIILAFFKKKSNLDGVKRILVIQAYGIGDVIMTTPSINLLKRRFADAEIDILVSKEASPLFKESNLITNSYYLGGYKSVFKLIKQLKNRRHDLIVIASFYPLFALVSILINPRIIIGYISDFSVKSIGIKKNGAEFKFTDHHIQAYAKPFELITDIRLDMDVDKLLTIAFSKNDKMYIDGITQNKKYIVLCPIVNWISRDWGLANFLQLGDSLIKSGYLIVYVGKTNNQEYLNIHSDTNQINLINKTSINQLAYLIKNSLLFITPDNGPMHIGITTGSKIIALFGPVDPKNRIHKSYNNVKYIYKKNSIPCTDGRSEPKCGGVDCIQKILLDDVVNEINKMPLITVK